jgi:hypothetical protein
LEKLTQGIRLSLTKYPISILFAAIAAMLLIVTMAEDGDGFEFLSPYIIGCAMGISLFFAIHTTLEIKTWPGYIKGLALILGIGVLWLIVFDIQNHINNGTDQSQAIQIFGYGLLTHLVVAFLPFIGNFKINAFWQYNKSLFLRAFTTALYTGVLFAGISGAILAITELFDVDFGSKIYAYLWFIMALPMSVMIFTAGVPTDINELESSNDLPKGLRIFVQFILIPLVVLYLLILYAYMGKIIFQWSLPQGWVTILIMVFSVLGMLAMLLVYPYQHQKENSWVNWYTKGYYIALIPLLILQYVAILTRIEEYGFTAPRWAVLAITVWLTWITLYNVFFKGRNIVLIPLTLFITAFLYLLGPLSHKSISISSQTAKIHRLLTELQLVKNGKLLVYKDNPKTDSLMGELYSATRYLNRNYQKTGLEPYLKYPTEAEIQKQTYKGVGNTSERGFTEKNDHRQATRQILSDDLEKYNIHSYENGIVTATSGGFEIESQTPQNEIPAGNWTHYYQMEDTYINGDYDVVISSNRDLIKIKSRESGTARNLGSNLTIMVNGEEIEIPIQRVLAPELKRGAASLNFYTQIVPNNKLRFPFKKNGKEGILVVEKINFDVSETGNPKSADPNDCKIDRITACIFMK